MGHLGWAVLLALVLLEVASGGGDEEAGCCQLTRMTEGTVNLECHGNKKTGTTGQISETNNRTIISGLFKNNTSGYNTDSKSNQTINTTINSSNKCEPHWRTISQNVTKFEVNFLNGFSLLNLSSFPNVRTVIIRVNNSLSLKLCGKSSVSSVNAASNGLENISFTCELSNVTVANLSNNSIRDINFELLPGSLKSLDVSFNKLILHSSVSFPQNMLFLNVSSNNISSLEKVEGNLTVLDLSWNCLEFLPNMQLERLEELYASHNRIFALVNGTFSHLAFLTVLDLRGNKLKTVEQSSFDGLSKLQRLDISENSIVALEPTTLQYLTNLVTLKVSRNVNFGNTQEADDSYFLYGTSQRLQVIESANINITKIPATLSRSVRKLFLSNNLISVVQCGQLDSFPLLQVLDLSNNEVTDIEEDALGRLDFLSHLLLCGNNLQIVPKSLPDQLQVLDLRKNEINDVNKFEFLGLQKLKVLLLSKNKISHIEDGSFGQLVSLEVLDLSNNPIKTLSRTSLVGPRRLKEIYLKSLKELIPLQEPLSFPAPESAHLEVLNIESSPVLANQLMDDVAALTMFHELYHLNLNHCRLSTLRSDLPKYLPRLHRIELVGNAINCTNIIWLVKWLQALNISVQGSGKFRQEIYSLKEDCEDDEHDDATDSSVKCASPEYLVGREIISLKDEDFPDLKLTSSTLPSTRQLLINKSYLQQTSTDDTPNLIDSSPQTSPIINHTFTPSIASTISSTSFSTSSDMFSKTFFITPPSLNGTTSSMKTVLNSSNEFIQNYNNKITTLVPSTKSIANRTIVEMRSHSVSKQTSTTQLKPLVSITQLSTPFPSSDLNRIIKLKPKENQVSPTYSTTLEKPPLKRMNSINQEVQSFKYHESVERNFLDAEVIMLNETSSIQEKDNHTNDSASLGAFSAASTPPTSHPGMFLFLSVVGVILLASGAMAYSHLAQRRRSREYQHQQDIEVSSFGGYDLW